MALPLLALLSLLLSVPVRAQYKCCSAGKDFADQWTLRNALRQDYAAAGVGLPEAIDPATGQMIPHEANGFTYKVDPQSGRVVEVSGLARRATNGREDLSGTLMENYCDSIVESSSSMNVLTNRCGNFVYSPMHPIFANSPGQIARGHVVASSIGGTGDDPINLFPQWQRSNGAGPWYTFERAISDSFKRLVSAPDAARPCEGQINIHILFSDPQQGDEVQAGGIYKAQIGSLSCWQDLPVAFTLLARNAALGNTFQLNSDPNFPVWVATTWSNTDVQGAGYSQPTAAQLAGTAAVQPLVPFLVPLTFSQATSGARMPRAPSGFDKNWCQAASTGMVKSSVLSLRRIVMDCYTTRGSSTVFQYILAITRKGDNIQLDLDLPLFRSLNINAAPAAALQLDYHFLQATKSLPKVRTLPLLVAGLLHSTLSATSMGQR